MAKRRRLSTDVSKSTKPRRTTRFSRSVSWKRARRCVYKVDLRLTLILQFRLQANLQHNEMAWGDLKVSRVLVAVAGCSTRDAKTKLRYLKSLAILRKDVPNLWSLHLLNTLNDKHVPCCMLRLDNT